MMIYNDILPIDCGSVNVKQVLSKLIETIKDFVKSKIVEEVKIEIETEEDEWEETYPHITVFIAYKVRNTLVKIFIYIFTNKVQIMQKSSIESQHIDLIFERSKDYNFPDFEWIRQQFADLVKR